MTEFTDADYPTRGYSVEQPTILETKLTGWCATVRFKRAGHRYEIKFITLQAPRCLRDDRPIAWERLNSKAQATAHKAADFLSAAAKLSREA